VVNKNYNYFLKKKYHRKKYLS